MSVCQRFFMPATKTDDTTQNAKQNSVDSIN